MTVSRQTNVFVSAMAFDRGQSGISRYIESVVSELATRYKVTVLVLQDDLSRFHRPSSPVTFVTWPAWLRPAALNMLAHLLVLPLLLGNRYDVVFLPALNRRLLAWSPRYTVGTFHDLSQYHMTCKYDWLRTFYIRHIVPLFVRQVDTIVAISECTRRDLAGFYGLSPERIKVCYNGYEPLATRTGGLIAANRLPNQPPGDYILYVSRVEHPGKNHVNLIAAYELLPAPLRQRYALVCAGAAKERSEEVIERARRSPDSDRVYFTGFISDDALVRLYSEAAIFVHPSLFGGFGLPLLEAMAFGVPIACANRGPLPEVGGDAVALFEPEDPQSIAAAIVDQLLSLPRRAELANRGRDRLRVFTWQRHVDGAMSDYESRPR